jgi:hypothetical protein
VPRAEKQDDGDAEPQGEDEPRPDHRHQRHHGEADGDGHGQFRAQRIVRPVQQAVVQDVLEQLGVDLDAGGVGLQRRRLDVEQSDGRGADQHQRVGERAVGQPAFQDVGGGDEAAGIMAGEMHPQLAVAVGGDGMGPDPDAAHARGVAAHRDRLLAQRDPQQLDGQRRPDLTGNRHDGRHPAHHPVEFRLHGDQAAARRRGFQFGQVGEQARQADEERPRIAAERDDRVAAPPSPLDWPP